MNKSSSTILIVAGLVLVLCCCLVVILGGAFYVAYQFGKVLPTIASYTTILPPPTEITPTPSEITREPVDDNISSTLRLLENTNVPTNDLRDLACRLKGICDTPLTMAPPSSPLTVGTQQTFWISNEDTNNDFQVTATLGYVTAHSYFWAENGAEVDQQEMKSLMDTFEGKIYPTDRAFFGSEWTPGVDGDPHIYILYASGIGSSVAGYYSPADEYTPLVREHSNAHEMFVINTSESLSYEYTYGTLAHEFQHMIHWYQDRNEGGLINEGFSELAVFINGYDTGGFDSLYLNNPDINLTDWEPSTADNGAHYGANFLFTNYFLNRFGEQTTQALVHDPLNGLESVDEVLRQQNITDPLTGQLITADDFFLDWTLANYIHDPSVGDGRYYYHNYPNSPTSNDTEGLSSCPQGQNTRTVNQYGVDYIRFTCLGNYTIDFTGSTLTRLLPADPHSGSYAFWSNQGDESEMTLTRRFDLSGVSGPVTFSYWTWYDLEKDYDYVFLEISTDGATWNILTTPSGTGENPTGNSYGWGYTGQSNGWIQETVDLSQFAGQVVSLRFDYITDAAVNGEGFLVDDITIPEVGFTEGFESGDGGWEGAGFVLVQNVLPQTFRLALITHAANATTVDIVPVNADQTAQIPVTIGSKDVQDVVLVVTATARFTRVQAEYQFEIR
jgi:immune inhibitor A